MISNPVLMTILDNTTGEFLFVTRHGICHRCTDIIHVTFHFMLFLVNNISCCFVVLFLVNLFGPIEVNEGKQVVLFDD